MRTFQYAACLALIVAPASNLYAGEKQVVPVEKPSSSTGDWCEWLDDAPGELYKNKDNPIVQEFSLRGRFHWQYGYVDGRGLDVATRRDIEYDTEEIRRFRLGFKADLFRYFTLSTAFDLEDDQAPAGFDSGHDIEYADIYSATLSFDAEKAFDLEFVDDLKISVGKHKVNGSAEFAVSSRFIKTVERSSLSNFVTPPSSTGLVVSAEKGPWDFSIGMFSGDFEPEFAEFDGANDYFYTLRFGRSTDGLFGLEDSRIDLRVIVNGDDVQNATANPDSPGAYNLDWVASLGFTAEHERFTLLTDVIYGENGTEFNTNGAARPLREGSFWGVVVLPTYWIVEDKLEAVFRYQYARASEEQGIRLNSRYIRRAGSQAGVAAVAEGRGDEHHSAYLGLNYYLCEDNAKLMFGIEYDELSSGDREIYEGFSAWIAFRMYFK